MVAELQLDLDTETLELAQSYLWGRDLSGSMQGAGGVGGLLAVLDHTDGTDVHFAISDANGNVSALVDGSDGTLSAEYGYGPFGEPTKTIGSMAKKNPFRFSTKYTDNETGLVYYGFRYYDPETGRWLNRDPIEEQGEWNLYGFVGNDGVNAWDYLGLAIAYVGFSQETVEKLKKIETLARIDNLYHYPLYAEFPQELILSGATWVIEKHRDTWRIILERDTSLP